MKRVPRSDWNLISGITRSVSLFVDQGILDIKILTGKLGNGKLGRSGANTLAKLAEQVEKQADPNTSILIALSRLDKSTHKIRLVQGHSDADVMIDFANIERYHFPARIRHASDAAELTHRQSVTGRWTASKVEGNLLATYQEMLYLLSILKDSSRRKT